MPTTEKQNQHSHTNALVNESSPYLLQHAHNPVNWMPWGEEALSKAKEENKPLIISIGYSACHWCHVMEEESFEDTAVAKLMNENFVCIKVDREERPDIDQIYMNAVQLMTGGGGWPLNCFATPDGRPFYGGTYFPKEKWMEILNRINQLYREDSSKVYDYADQIVQGIKSTELIEVKQAKDSFQLADFEAGLEKWKSIFDSEYGGNQQAPKFPIPNNYLFLLNYYYHSGDEKIKHHLLLTLEKMAYGGIYDQIGGGFARYSTDLKWKVPHFEKMLYDNAQLISLYSISYRLNQNPLYKKVVEESIGFVEEELTAPNGAFYSSLDADSEGEEGRFYVWTKEELKSLLGTDYDLAKAYFNINSYGRWENENYILIRKAHNDELAEKFNLSPSDFEDRIASIKQTLKQARNKRVKPGLDDKSLTSWNALMISGLVDAYFSFEETSYLEKAIKNANFIQKQQMREDGGLWHNYKDGKSSINGFLEDYSFTIEAFIKLYEATLDYQWLEQAKSLTDYSIDHFYDKKSKLFYFTNHKDPKLVNRSKEINDNVIPASNSAMGRVLFRLGKLYPDEDYEKVSREMLQQIVPRFEDYLPSYSNWAILLMEHSETFFELAVSGKDAKKKLLEIHKQLIPNKIVMGNTKDEAPIELLKGKWVDGETYIYVCENFQCLRPVTEVEEALQLMSER